MREEEIRGEERVHFFPHLSSPLLTCPCFMPEGPPMAHELAPQRDCPVLSPPSIRNNEVTALIIQLQTLAFILSLVLFIILILILSLISQIDPAKGYYRTERQKPELNDVVMLIFVRAIKSIHTATSPKAMLVNLSATFSFITYHDMSYRSTIDSTPLHITRCCCAVHL